MSNQLAVYDFTLKADDREPDEVLKHLRTIGKKFCFQKEEGDTGYVHYQGRVSLFKKRRLTECKALFSSVGYGDIHLSPTSNEAQKGPPFYCMKLDTRIDGPWTDAKEEVYVPRQYRDILDNLHAYQQTIWDSADRFDPRTINYIYDIDGNNGKSTIASLMELYKRGIDLPPMNDSEKLIQSVCDILMATENRDPKCMFIDMPRAMDKKRLGSMYSAIEQIKKGKVFDTRYSYKSWWFDSPQIWVFANSRPDLSYLSQDRWRLWEIKNGTLVPLPAIGPASGSEIGGPSQDEPNEPMG